MIALTRSTTGPGAMVVELGDPMPDAGEALIRPTRVGIGAGDLAVARGEVAHAGVMGHQFVGVVERVNPASGREEQKRWEGKRVVGSIDLACGACERCKGGLSAHCAARRVLGLHQRDGCFAERFTLPIANLVEAPHGVEDERAIFAVEAGAAMHVPHLLRFEGKTYVSVLGDGVNALLVAQVLTRLNASVRVIGSGASRLAHCERWGIRHRPAGEVGLRQDQDVVVECTGSAAGLGMALRMVRPRGKVVLMGVPAPVPAGALAAPREGSACVDLSPAVVNEIELVGARASRVGDAMAALARREIDAAGLVSRRFKLADGVAALREAERADAIKVVMEP